MKFRITLCAVFLIVALAWVSVGQAQTDNYTGTWYNPPQDGHGLNIERLESGDLLVIWYVYRPDGTSTFLLGIATQVNGVWSATLQQTGGMVFGDFDPATNQLNNWGTIQLVFSDCNSGTLTWTSGITGYPNGSIPIQRLTSVQGGNCNDSPWVGNYAMSINDPDPDAGTSIGFASFTPDGQVMYVLRDDDETLTGRGTWQQNGNRITTQSIFYSEEDDEPELFNVTFDRTRDGLAGTAAGSIDLTLSRMESFQDDLSLASLAGSYDTSNAYDDNDLGVLTIDGNGRLTGSLDECTLNGQFSIPDQNFNQANLSVDVSQCGSGTFEGAAYRRDGTLTLMLVEETLEDATTLEMRRR